MDADKIVRRLAERIARKLAGDRPPFPPNIESAERELASVRELIEEAREVARNMRVFSEEHWIGRFGRKLDAALAKLDAEGEEGQ